MILLKVTQTYFVAEHGNTILQSIVLLQKAQI